MEAQLLLARALSRCSLSRPASRLLRPAQHQARHKSTAARTKRSLNIAPHPSFLSESSSPPNTSTSGPPTTTVVFNPPASAAPVHHTPFKFLPKTDPRRRRNLSALFERSTTLAYSTEGGSEAAALPPRVEHEYYTSDKYHLTPDDVAEIRRLRAEDPLEWSVLKLAEKYNCSPIFVMLVVRSSKEHREAMKAPAEAAKSRWGPIRTRAREDRRKRRAMLFKGEI